jgi:RND family efflux transporter MFP subunit
MKKMFLFLAVTIAFFCGCTKDQQTTTEQKVTSTPEVVTGIVKSGPVYKAYTGVGSIMPEEYARITPKIAGRISNIPVDEGSYVKKGQMLMELDTFDYLRALENASAIFHASQATLDKVSNDFNRMEQLHKASAISEQNYQDAKTALDLAKTQHEQAKAGFEIAEQNLKECKIISPISGIVTDKFVNKGELTGPGQPVFVVMQMDRVKVEVDLPEAAFRIIKKGNKGHVTVDAFPDETFEGVITKINPTIDPLSRTFKVTIELANPGLKLRSGMTARTNVVEKAKENAITVPNISLVRGEEGYHVFRVVSDTIQKISVKIGIEGSEETEVFGGLSVGDKVVTKGLTGLNDGMKVKILNQELVATPKVKD